jgi:hypothetical protein
VFDGTNLGVGGTSAGPRIQARGTINNEALISSIRTDSGIETAIGSDGGLSAGFVRTVSNHSLVFGQNNTEGMRLTSTGLGIGTSSPSNPLHIVSNTVSQLNIAASSGNTNAQINLEPTGTGIALIGPANNVAFAFRTNATERLRIDASGKLGLGMTPSGSYSLQIYGVGASAGSARIRLNNSSTGTADADGGGIAMEGVDLVIQNSENGVCKWEINGSERARITAAGDLVVGGTTANLSSASRGVIEVNGASTAYIGLDTGGTLRGTFYSNGSIVGLATATLPLTFGTTGGTEWGRFDTSGNLLAGSTSSSFNERIVSHNGASYTFGSYRTGTGSEGHVIFVNGNGAVGSIFTNGSSTSFNTSSDYRLKNITGNLTGYKERLMSLQPKQGTWKVDGSEFRGFLAHEFANPYSASVSGEKDAVDAEGKPIMQSMQASSSEVMADLVALVQEQQAIIESLKARLDAANL